MELFLIAHKVRGVAAFDIAWKIEIEGDLAWIIPTSGHRAYPYAQWLLEDLYDGSDINNDGWHNRPLDWEDKMPEGLRDHYEITRAVKPKQTIDLDDLLSDII